MCRMDLSLLKSKFRGSMLGVLVGDCLGSPYEGDKLLSAGAKLVLQKSFDKLEGPFYKAPVMQFTDDSAMTRSVAESLIEKGDLDLVDMAKKFVKSYYREPKRGYGSGVVAVFQKLRANKFSDLLKPAREQFDGLGSYGNGGAMRVVPIALFCHQNYEHLVEMARAETQITHAHDEGINGAILQATAVHQSLLLDPSQQLNAESFLDELIGKMNEIESEEEGLDLSEPQPFQTRLHQIKRFLALPEGPHGDAVTNLLGTNISAVGSVPTAIFCFLRAQKPIDGIETDNPFRRTIQYAISLGGDTDTIGSMAGAIAGAFYGEEKISPAILKHCEASNEFQLLGDKLYDVAVSHTAENIQKTSSGNFIVE